MSQIASFQERIDRINRGEQYVADYLIPKDIRQLKQEKRRRMIRFGAIMSFLFVFFLGIVSVMLIRYGRFQVLGIERADLTSLEGVVLDAVGSLLMIVFLVFTTKLNSWLLVATQTAGAVASFLGMHWVVHKFPAVFGELFSLQWLFMVIQTTDPQALLQISF